MSSDLSEKVRKEYLPSFGWFVNIYGRSNKMNCMRLLLHIICSLLIVFLLGACAAPQATTTLEAPVVTATSEPPTGTPTLVPSTKTPTPAPPTATLTSIPPTATLEPEIKILFVGNSLTYWKNGLYHHLEQLAGSVNPPRIIEADAVTEGGMALFRIWDKTNVREVIGNGTYDIVVLQEGLTITDADTFHEVTRKFDEESRSAGADILLFMAWPNIHSELTYEDIALAHDDIATELGIEVAPAGLAWQRAIDERPDLDMYDADRVHPSIHGIYLSVNVLFATIFGESPSGLTYLPDEAGGVTDEEAAFLQRIAWETVQEYQAQK